MKKINPAIIMFIALISLILIYVYVNKYSEKSSQEQENQDKILLDKLLTEIKSGNFSTNECDSIKTNRIKQQCYKAFLAKKISNNEIFNKDVCYSLVEGSDKEVCLLWSTK